VSFYSRHIFPRMYDWVMDRPFWTDYRAAQLANVHGDILEIGVGTGLNLPHYPSHVRMITTVDPNPGMNKRLQRRIKKAGMEIDRRIISCEQLPFTDASFDCVVSTLTMCSIPNLNRAISELFRVLKPGGRLYFLEHGISPDTKVARWQRRLNPLQRIFVDGCTLTLNVPELLPTELFSPIEFDNFYIKQLPKTYGYMFRGTATK
jgi:ubiquinone/menaquinone biosynthesis C-methylase UbiE